MLYYWFHCFFTVFHGDILCGFGIIFEREICEIMAWNRRYWTDSQVIFFYIYGALCLCFILITAFGTAAESEVINSLPRGKEIRDCSSNMEHPQFSTFLGFQCFVSSCRSSLNGHKGAASETLKDTAWMQLGMHPTTHSYHLLAEGLSQAM